MFGYVRPNSDELKIKEARVYRSYYCGLCHEIGKYTGMGRITLSYDMTFLAMLLDSLYDEEKQVVKKRCICHPFRRHLAVEADSVRYAAKINILLSYDNLMDKWHDERNLGGYLGGLFLRAKKNRIAREYPRQSKAIADYIEALHKAEAEKKADLDLAAGLTGQMLSDIYDWHEDEWSKDLRGLGFFIGKFVYLADAYDDLRADKKKGAYNPFAEYEKVHPDTDIETYGRQVLIMMAAEAAKYFERLPLVDNIEILRNTLYSGIFVKIDADKKKENRASLPKDANT